jgi:hypothetical protein
MLSKLIGFAMKLVAPLLIARSRKFESALITMIFDFGSSDLINGMQSIPEPSGSVLSKKIISGFNSIKIESPSFKE